MKRHVVYGSIFAAALLLVISLVSVVGYQSVKRNEYNGSSPLFAVRTSQATQQTVPEGTATFLGKGAALSLFPSRSLTNEDLMRAIQWFQAHPAVVIKLLENIDRYPGVAGMLADRGVNTQDVKTYLRMIQRNPGLVSEALANADTLASSETDTQPLGLSTSNPLGCFIVAMVALIPITVVITLLVLLFTLRILTCMNVNDCANEIAEGIWDQLIQGLTQE
ncbi:MAG: hypothetical protein WC525_09905 [Candidatus Thermoplasmatota archaeon]